MAVGEDGSMISVDQYGLMSCRTTVLYSRMMSLKYLTMFGYILAAWFGMFAISSKISMLCGASVSIGTPCGDTPSSHMMTSVSLFVVGTTSSIKNHSWSSSDMACSASRSGSDVVV